MPKRHTLIQIVSFPTGEARLKIGFQCCAKAVLQPRRDLFRSMLALFLLFTFFPCRLANFFRSALLVLGRTGRLRRLCLGCRCWGRRRGGLAPSLFLAHDWSDGSSFGGGRSSGSFCRSASLGRWRWRRRRRRRRQRLQEL